MPVVLPVLSAKCSVAIPGNTILSNSRINKNSDCFVAWFIIKKSDRKCDSGVALYDTDIDFVWRIKRRDLGMQRNENLYKIWKVEYDN